ncbi:hypothetical protein ATANTOWER_000116 [Ataeniobius toweri]|uniref:Uncharacterized protein n=1 Tax=Ataeniobius toweri TaxID=208326 RepID=A0ABU7A3H5_9TELE|nr:hypothetical protein [Ataeniobius toweri]
MSGWKVGSWNLGAPAGAWLVCQISGSWAASGGLSSLGCPRVSWYAAIKGGGGWLALWELPRGVFGDLWGAPLASVSTGLVWTLAVWELSSKGGFMLVPWDTPPHNYLKWLNVI